MEDYIRSESGVFNRNNCISTSCICRPKKALVHA